MRREEIELLGLDDDDDELDADDMELLGAMPWIRSAKSARRASTRIMVRRRGKRRAVRRALKQPYPGVSGAGGPKVFPLGFPNVTFDNAGGGADLDTTANPQRPFKGNRLTIIVTRSAGAAAILVTLERFLVGTNSQLVSADPIPAETFQPNAFDVPLAISPAEPGVIITLTFGVSATPGVGETVTVGASVIGVTLG